MFIIVTDLQSGKKITLNCIVISGVMRLKGNEGSTVILNDKGAENLEVRETISQLNDLLQPSYIKDGKALH